MAVARSLIVDIAMNTAKITKDIQKIRGDFDQLGSAVKKLGGVLGVAFSINTLVRYGDAIIEQAKKAEQAENRITAVLRATGEAAGFTKIQLDAMADSMALSTQFDDESIRGAQAELLKFRNIHGEVFTDALKLSADVAAFFGEDIPEAAAKLGRSLVDPETAFGLLKRAGIDLSDQQKDMIKKLQETGQTAEAQRVILDRLKGSFAGTAEEMNTGITKATGDLSKAWDEMLEAFGRTSTVNAGLIATTGIITTLLRNVRELLDEMRNADDLIKLGLKKPEFKRFEGGDFGKPIGKGGFGDLPKTGKVLTIEDSEALEFEHQKRITEILKKEEAGRIRSTLEHARAAEDAIRAENEISEGLTREGITRQTEIIIAGEQEKRKRKLEVIRESILDEDTLLQEQFDRRLENIQIAYEMEIISKADRDSLIEQSELEHLARMGDMNAKAQLEGLKFQKLTDFQKIQNVLQTGEELTSSVATSSKTLFNINKSLALANAAVSLPDAVLQSFQKGGGYPWGLIPAGLMLAKGLAQIRAIKSASFGTSSSAPSVGGGGAISVTNVGASSQPGPTGTQQLPSQNITINIQNGMGDRAYWQGLIDDVIVPGINDARDRNINLNIRTV